MKKNADTILICALIGLCFLWTGSGYLTWMYHLLRFYPAPSVDIYTEIIGYVFQICGLLLVAIYNKKRHKLSFSTYASAFVMSMDLIFIILSALSSNGACTLFFGYLMNLFHGFVAGIYLTKLATLVLQQHRGIIFGLGYGLGSVGTWMISLIGNGNFLKSNYVLIIYAFLVLLSILILHISTKKTDYETDLSEQTFPLDNSVIILAGVIVFMASCIKNVGFYFPTADLSNSSISLELSRAFYAIGLITAGIINDKNRKWGAVCCIATLIFPFEMFVLQNNLGSSLILWIFSYIFFGYFAVYRVIVFSDMAGKSTQYLYLAGLGLLCGRCGDVAGATIGIILSNYSAALVLCTSVAFIITIFLFMNLFQKLYVPVPFEKKSKEDLLNEFGTLYQLSPRETEVFRLVVENYSNTEIAEYLFISENTVKFHIKNILRKTACTNRTGLIALFKKTR